jgi:hypothetical protein
VRAAPSRTTHGSGPATRQISDPEHVTAAKLLRSQRIGLVRPTAETDVEVRSLADYDTALGLDGSVDVDGTVA